MSFFIGIDGLVDQTYGGNWFTYLSLSDESNSCRFYSPDPSFDFVSSFQINNIIYWSCRAGANLNWYGATYTTNPLGVPETTGIKWWRVNTPISVNEIKKIIRFLDYRLVGGSVTIEYNGLYVQYGISVTSWKKMYVGVGNTAKKVTKLYVGVNGTPRNVVKGYVGVNGVPHKFWG